MIPYTVVSDRTTIDLKLMGELPERNYDKLSLAFCKIKLLYIDFYGFLFAGFALR